ncbi:hypothetical protein KJ885_01565 [Patescibacteria group bacterium]|nr:hypothetical protein [Patescibacteria group bacterium]
MRKNETKGRFILVAGLDGAGKTTAMKGALPELQKNCDIVYLKGIGSDNLLGRLAKRFGISFLFLAELLYMTYFPLRKALKQGKVVLMDKYFFFTASHIPDVDTRFNRFLLRICGPLMTKPDTVVYFLLERNERIKRLKAGPYSKYHQRLIDNPDWILEREIAYTAIVRASGAKIIFSDNTGLNITQSVSVFKNIILYFLKGEAQDAD